ncbi:hypothetical protein C0P33_004923, partial [Escherichia coli]|nr:hypothetical protein [Escherichia coli]
NTTGLIIGQPPEAAISASEADPAPEPETKEEQSIWDMMLMIQMDESRAKIEASAVQLDLAIGAAKAFWNQFPDMATMIGQGATMQYAGEMQMNGAMLSAMGMDDIGEDMYNMGGDLREHAGDFNLDMYRLEMSNRNQEIGGMIYDYGSLALGGYGLARGGFVGLRAMRTASKLAREEAAAG